jgi:hypothetical protein
VKAGEACAVVESVKTASDIYSPVSGEIVEVNKPVTDKPDLVNTEPYAGGWFFKIKLSNPRRTERACSRRRITRSRLADAKRAGTASDHAGKASNDRERRSATGKPVQPPGKRENGTF